MLFLSFILPACGASKYSDFEGIPGCGGEEIGGEVKEGLDRERRENARKTRKGEESRDQ